MRYGVTTAPRNSSHRERSAREPADVCTDAAVELPLSSALASAKSCRRTPIAQCETSRPTPFAQLLKSIETSLFLPPLLSLLLFRSISSQRTQRFEKRCHSCHYHPHSPGNSVNPREARGRREGADERRTRWPAA